MNKIILGYEKLSNEHEGWNFNGRLEPSRIQLDESEIAALGHYERFIYQNIIAPERFTATHRPILADARLQRGVTWDRKQISDIGTDVYFYPIEILGITSYTKYTSHIAINKRTLEDIRNLRAYLVFSYLYEGDLAAWPDSINKFCSLVRELELPRSQVLMFHGDRTRQNYIDMPFTYYPASTQYGWLAHRVHMPLAQYNLKKLYLTYAQQTSPHRILLLKMLKDRYLLAEGIFSFGSIDREKLHWYNHHMFRGILTPDDYDFFLSIQNTSPDQKDWKIDSCAANICDQHYQDSFLSIVGETLWNTAFFSEKTYKPLIAGHPFISFGGPGQIKALHEIGVKTFSDWWDEDYDQCEDLFERTDKIVKIIEKLVQKTTPELKQMRVEMQKNLLHNKQLVIDWTQSKHGQHEDIASVLLKLINNHHD